MASELQRRKWTNLFRLYDADADGAITRSDMELMTGRIAEMRGLEPGSPGHQELKEGFTSFWNLLQGGNANRDDRVDQQEWLRFSAQLTESDDRYRRVVQPLSITIFRLLDQDGDGQITFDEYRRMYAAVGVGEEQAREIFTRLDLSQDGAISLDEALVLTDQYFLGDDPDAPGNWFFGPV